jgi:branched-chain amino acid aminotransferase
MVTDWSKLTFSYTKTNTIVSAKFSNGKWSPLESSSNDDITISALSGSLHYGLQAFEGLKAFRGEDGKVRIFRPEENAHRMKRSADYIGLEAPSVQMFIEACERVVRENIEFLPPFESGASMYIRPLIIGVGPQLGVHISEETLFVVAAAPIGAYFGSTLVPSKAVLARMHDRAAPHGTGSYKLGGNYSGTVLAGKIAKKQGYTTVLYLDSAERKYIDEFSAANFFGIKGNSYITPDSPSILPSITNKSLMVLAEDNGLKVEKRRVPVEELAQFEEVGAVGTAVVVSPICQIDDKPGWEGFENTGEAVVEKEYRFGTPQSAGEKSQLLYKLLTGIQSGVVKDKFGWCHILDEK